MIMRPFAYRRAADQRDALAAAALAGTSFIAGGTELMQLWKLGICAPRAVIDINALPFAAITVTESAITIGALARLADVAEHPTIGAECAAVAEALLASASPQLRNMATIGGNLLQRTRCAYFRSSLPCNKREPGSGCGALAGENRPHALFGTSAHCVAAHASDLAVALVGLDASVRLRGPEGERSLALEEFYLMPDAHPERETQLERASSSSGRGAAHGAVTKLALPQAARPGFLRVRGGLGGGGTRDRGWHDPRGAHLRRRRRHEAVAAARL